MLRRSAHVLRERSTSMAVTPRLPASMLRLCTLACAVAIAGCGGDDNDGEQATGEDCALTVTLSGAVEVTTSGKAPCDASGSYPPGPRTVVTFIGLPGDQGEQMKFALHEVSEGTTGMVQADVGVVRQSSQQAWQTPGGACTIDVAEHTVVDDNYPDVREYRVGGTGSCNLGASGPSGTVDISEFSMRGMVFWEK